MSCKHCRDATRYTFVQDLTLLPLQLALRLVQCPSSTRNSLRPLADPHHPYYAIFSHVTRRRRCCARFNRSRRLQLLSIHQIQSTTTMLVSRQPLQTLPMSSSQRQQRTIDSRLHDKDDAPLHSSRFNASTDLPSSTATRDSKRPSLSRTVNEKKRKMGTRDSSQLPNLAYCD